MPLDLGEGMKKSRGKKGEAELLVDPQYVIHPLKSVETFCLFFCDILHLHQLHKIHS